VGIVLAVEEVVATRAISVETKEEEEEEEEAAVARMEATATEAEVMVVVEEEEVEVATIAATLLQGGAIMVGTTILESHRQKGNAVVLGIEIEIATNNITLAGSGLEPREVWMGS